MSQVIDKVVRQTRCCGRGAMFKYIYNELGCYSGLLSLQHFARLRLALRPLALFPENLIITFAQIRVRKLSDPLRSAPKLSVPRPYNPSRPFPRQTSLLMPHPSISSDPYLRSVVRLASAQTRSLCCRQSLHLFTTSLSGDAETGIS
jgi:hypothetical protein